MVDLGADPDRLGEGGRAGRDDHELLQVDRVLPRATPPLITFSIGTGSVLAVVAAEVAVERDAGLRGGGLGRRERDAEDRVRAETALVRRAVGVDQRGVDRGLVGGVETGDGLAQRAVHVRDGPGDALAAPRGAAVAQLDRLVHAGRGARRDDRRSGGAGLEPDVDLDGRVPARVEHLPPAHVGDPGHTVSFARSK